MAYQSRIPYQIQMHNYSIIPVKLDMTSVIVSEDMSKIKLKIQKENYDFNRIEINDFSNHITHLYIPNNMNNIIVINKLPEELVDLKIDILQYEMLALPLNIILKCKLPKNLSRLYIQIKGDTLTREFLDMLDLPVSLKILHINVKQKYIDSIYDILTKNVKIPIDCDIIFD